ncbi:WcaI family glycosyltransferase [Arcticibacter tournemirensis]|uniref:Colanic acid biosynthesis glycosyltransferase WcaI n=1 Tax=Arcticibacter tournemirensis TaxID=699437 RepID=A0A4Q0M8H0_9SPHI|nr:WcaI family glycosyltransferase [Arcticibacter tournemirensis]RXF69427.1 colanic acid biosynthesis glycosyltransferase WcaI [Arcticibacter tournemirensis]
MDHINTLKKRVLLMGINFAPELTGIGKYTGEMADWLVENGYECTVVTSFPYYPNWKVQAPYSGRFYKKEVQKNGKLRVYRCPQYVPLVPSGSKRVLQEATFILSSFFIIFYLLFKKRHQQIFCMAPPFHLGFLALFYRFFKGGKIVYHIHDLQIEAARDLKVLKTERAFKFLFALERFILNRVNFVSTVSPGMLKRITKKVKQEVLFFPNWGDLSSFYPLTGRAALKKQWGFRPDDKVVLYSGSIGEKQGLESLLSIAKELEGQPFIKFVICGNGPYKEKLSRMASEKQLKNMFFMPLQPLSLFNSFLNMADVHLVIQRKEACDLMLPSKLISIFAIGGLALVTAEPGSSLHTTMIENGMGVVIDCENEVLLQNTILDCCISDYTQANLNGRIYAERFLDRENILQRIMQQIREPKASPVPVIDYQFENA